MHVCILTLVVFDSAHAVNATDAAAAATTDAAAAATLLLPHVRYMLHTDVTAVAPFASVPQKESRISLWIQQYAASVRQSQVAARSSCSS